MDQVNTRFMIIFKMYSWPIISVEKVWPYASRSHPEHRFDLPWSIKNTPGKEDLEKSQTAMYNLFCPALSHHNTPSVYFHCS